VLNIRKVLSGTAIREERTENDLERLSETCETLRQMGYKIVLTQGVYDLLHIGHVRYLEKARAEGDILILGVDSDELTRRRKGPKRPIVPLGERLALLSRLRCVDILTVREVSHGIDDLIIKVKPDVLVVSFTTKDFPEEKQKLLEKYCGRVVQLEAQAETSTSAKIRTLLLDGARELKQRIDRVLNEYFEGEES